jgi:MFS family permease
LTRPPDRVAERRLLLLVAAVVFFDTMFYAALVPLLPKLVHELRLSKSSAGLLSASYALGVLAGSIPGALLATRAGPRSTVLVGLALLACSTLAFGFIDDFGLLCAVRAMEGIGGSCAWAGGFAWLVAEGSQERRGGLIGTTIGAAVAGALFGPVIGYVAVVAGRSQAFAGLAVLALILILVTRRLPSSQPPSLQGLSNLWRASRDRRVIVGVWLVALPALASGTLNVLGPLRLHRFGASTAAIAVTFTIAAAVEAVVSPATGRMSDRWGRLVPVRIGLMSASIAFATFTLPTAVASLSVLIIVIAATLGAFWAPAMAMLADDAESRGLDQALAAALMNIGWAAGQVLGAAAGGALARVWGDAVPSLIVAGLCTGTLLMVGRTRLTARAAAG